MNNPNCNIVKDLLPLYIDDVLSQESKEFVEQHIKECAGCRAELDLLKKVIPEDIEPKVNPLKIIHKKFFYKKVIIGLISVLCVFLLVVSSYLFVRYYEIPIEYDPNIFEVVVDEEGNVGMMFKGIDYSMVRCYTDTVTIDGKEQNIAYIYYSETLHSKYFSKEGSYSRADVFSIGNMDVVSDNLSPNNTDLTKVYYLIEDYQQIIEKKSGNFSDVMEKATLVWEK